MSFAARPLADSITGLLAVAPAELRDVFARDEELLLEQAGRLLFSGFERAVTYWRHCADDTRAEERAQRLLAGRNGSAVRTWADAIHVQAWLDTIGGTIVMNEWE